MLFVSHCTADDAFVDELAAALGAEGFETWIDHHDMPAGAKWVKQLEMALGESDAMLLVLSEQSLESPYVEAEWHAFFEMKKPIFPIRLDDAEMPLFLRGFHQLDFRDECNAHTAFKELMAVLHHQFGGTIRSGGIKLPPELADKTSALSPEVGEHAELRHRASQIVSQYPHPLGNNEIMFVLPPYNAVIHKALLPRMTVGRKHRSNPEPLEIDLRPYDLSPGVSRRHAEIRCTAQGVQIIDMGSTNGTYIGNVRLKPRKPYPLENGDIIFFSPDFPVYVRYRTA